uniref:High mobility group B protein 14 isoform X2 n=1 Tax=Rhizophora mucronata TaxID=61149 RepID=A0A2P2JPY8_RHIMU
MYKSSPMYPLLLPNNDIRYNNPKIPVLFIILRTVLRFFIFTALLSFNIFSHCFIKLSSFLRGNVIIFDFFLIHRKRGVGRLFQIRPTFRFPTFFFGQIGIGVQV